MSRPKTSAEWQAYISSLAGQELYSQAVAANTQTFARALLDEQLTMQDVEHVMLLFVRQLRATGTKVPKGGAFDLVTMALTDPIASKGPQMSEEDAEDVAVSYVDQADDFDQFELEAAFD